MKDESLRRALLARGILAEDDLEAFDAGDDLPVVGVLMVGDRVLGSTVNAGTENESTVHATGIDERGSYIEFKRTDGETLRMYDGKHPEFDLDPEGF